MEIFTLLETLEDILEKSKTVPFTEKSIAIFRYNKRNKIAFAR